MMADLVCWKCGVEVRDVPLPVGRSENCPSCLAGLRACRGCDFFRIDSPAKCGEPMAETPRDTEAANMCDYFRPAKKGEGDQSDEAAAARAKIKELFGGD